MEGREKKGRLSWGITMLERSYEGGDEDGIDKMMIMW
jgi:hypothetical protein